MAHSQNVGNDDGMESFGLGGGFGFTGVGMDRLGATEYTLVDIEVDVTQSTWKFATELKKMLIAAVESCKKSPRSDNLLVRVALFSTSVGGVRELHGYKPLSEIDTSQYPDFDPDGLTTLYDAAYTGITSMVAYGATLMENEFLVNGIQFLITDGVDNQSTATPRMVAQAVAEARAKEKLESILTILIGVNAAEYERYLTNFQTEATLDRYMDAGEATPAKLAKLADFVSQSVSSQSQSLGTGGPSQNIAATI